MSQASPRTQCRTRPRTHCTPTPYGTRRPWLSLCRWMNVQDGWSFHGGKERCHGQGRPAERGGAEGTYHEDDCRSQWNRTMMGLLLFGRGLASSSSSAWPRIRECRPRTTQTSCCGFAASKIFSSEAVLEHWPAAACEAVLEHWPAAAASPATLVAAAFTGARTATASDEPDSVLSGCSRQPPTRTPTPTGVSWCAVMLVAGLRVGWRVGAFACARPSVSAAVSCFLEGHSSSCGHHIKKN